MEFSVLQMIFPLHEKPIAWNYELTACVQIFLFLLTSVMTHTQNITISPCKG